MYIATQINSAHIDKLRDISCGIIAVGDDWMEVMADVVNEINDKLEYFDVPKTVTSADFVYTESGDNGQEWVYDSDEIGMTYTITQWVGCYLTIV